MSTREQFLAAKQRGSVAGSTDLLVIEGAVRKDTPGDLAGADGRYGPLQMDAVGNLRVVSTGGSDASAANQVSQIAGLASIDSHVNGLEAATGAPADAAAGADTGSFSLIAIAKRVLARWTLLLAATGAAGDAKSAATDGTPISIVSILKQLSAYLAGFLGVVGSAAVVVQTMAGASGNGSGYVAGDLFGNSASANNVANVFPLAAARAVDKTFVVTRVRAKINDSAFATKRVRFWFLKNSPAALLPADNGALGAGANFNENTQIGTITITFGSVASADGYVKGYGYPDDTAGVVWTCDPASGTANIFAVAELLDAVTVTASGKVMTLAVEVAGQN